MANQNLGIDVEINARLERLDKEMRRAGRIVEASTSDMDRSTQRAAKSFSRLEGRIDPAARALQRYERDAEKVRRALEKGAVSQERANQVLRRLELQYDKATNGALGLGAAQDELTRQARQSISTRARLNGVYDQSIAQLGQLAAQNRRVVSSQTSYVRTAATARRGTSSFGLAAQNAAFQVGDFATQISSGQSATRALAQQLPQLLGGFGVFGAVIGGAVAVAGALAPVLLDIGENTDKASDATTTYKESLEALEEIQKRVNDQGKTRIERLREQGRAALEGAEAELQAAQERLKALAIQNEQDLFGAGRRQRSQDAQGDAVQELVDAQERLQKLREDLNKTIEQARQQEAEEASGGGGSNGGRVSAAERYGIPDQSQLDRLNEQIRLQRMSARERAQAQAVTQAQNEAMKEGNLLSQQEAELIRQRAGTLFDLRNSAKDAADEVKRAQDITERYSEEIRTLESLGDRAFSRIGSAITQMAVEGQDAMTSLQNVGQAVVSELMQAFIELAAINPLKNALLGGDRATLSSVGGLIGELIGGIGTGGGTAPAIGAGGGASFSAQAAAPGATVGGVGFADGGSFTVGSQFPTINAGRDNRLVTVPMRDGERVDVTPAGMGGGSGDLEVNVYNETGTQATADVQRRPNGNGGQRIDVRLRQLNKQDIASGAYDKEMAARYGLRPSTGTR